ncbi:MAG TPA: M13 family metallopeptidase [Steroidobacteraceae bacterium]|nr:M13 family metallopeptidase [Steroidobacteraceae bacterium]
MSTRPDGRRSCEPPPPRTVPLRAAAFAISLSAALSLLSIHAARAGAAASSESAAVAPGSAAGAAESTEVSSDGLNLSWLDRSVSPGEDFFRFANGGWLKSHPIPPDRSYWGIDTILERDNELFIRDLVESLAKGDWPVGSAERKVADFYASGMDEAAIDAAGVAPLEPELARIAAVDDLQKLVGELAHLQMIGVAAPLAVGQMQDFENSTQVIAVVSQSGLGLPNRDYYLKGGHMFVAARTAYLEHVARMLSLLGDEPAAASREARTVMALETRLAAASMSEADQRDPHAVYHPMTLARAQQKMPRLRWRQLFEGLGHPEIASLNLGMPKFFEVLDRELGRRSLEDWKTYLRWQLIDSYAPYLSKPFVDEDFRMSAALSGAQELQARWLRVLRAEDDALGFAIGQLYVARKFSPSAKEAVTAMVSRIRDALSQDLQSLAWMSPATRAAAQRKLDLMELHIGYPDRWRDYSALPIDRGPYVLNVMRANEFEQRRQLAKIGQPVDRSEWYMTPQTVNAYYNPTLNSLNLPAGILQPPYFDVSWPDPVNYGATGATIGHEMTHGFDDEGAQFDGYGNLKNWWEPADLARFHKATRCISEQYSRYTVGEGLHVQGDLATGEATADLGGLVLAWRALHARRSDESPDATRDTAPQAAQGEAGMEEFTPDQQFFIAYAHSWAGAIRPKQAEEMVTTDPHPPADDRTNGTLANSPEFQAAFGIKGPSPMVKPDRCVIW